MRAVQWQGARSVAVGEVSAPRVTDPKVCAQTSRRVAAAGRRSAAVEPCPASAPRTPPRVPPPHTHPLALSAYACCTTLWCAAPHCAPHCTAGRHHPHHRHRALWLRPAPLSGPAAGHEEGRHPGPRAAGHRWVSLGTSAWPWGIGGCCRPDFTCAGEPEPGRGGWLWSLDGCCGALTGVQLLGMKRGDILGHQALGTGGC